MTNRLCPECDTLSAGAICPKCGTRTFFEAESESDIDPLLGRVLDQRYRIEERIGRGGMGTVYRAVQIAMNKVVAVKVMNHEIARHSEAVKRFHREAKAATAFDHPHAIRLIDFGQADTRELFMVMEFLDGLPLSQALKDAAPFTVERAAKVAGEIAKALASAHQVGLVHRDMKPDNVFLLDVAGDSDFVKVLDFGIAKFVSGTGDSTMTKTGLIVGTPHFMAPEQVRPGGDLTPAIDVYALGVILYIMLTGQHPYKGDTPLDALMAHVNEPVPDLPAAVTAPDNLRALVRSMLAKEPRYRPTAAEVVTALERVRLVEMAKVLGEPPDSRMPGRRWTETTSDSPPSCARKEGSGMDADPAPRVALTESFLAPEKDVEAGRVEANDTPDYSTLDADDIAAFRPRRNRIWMALGIVALVAAGVILGVRAVVSDPGTLEPAAPVQQAEARAAPTADSAAREATVLAPTAGPATLTARAPAAPPGQSGAPVSGPGLGSDPVPVYTAPSKGEEKPEAAAPLVTNGSAPGSTPVVAPAPTVKPAAKPNASGAERARAKPKSTPKPAPKKTIEPIW